MSVGEGNETFLIRVWKPLLSRRVLKLQGEVQKRKSKEDSISKQCAWAVTNGIRARHWAVC